LILLFANKNIGYLAIVCYLEAMLTVLIVTFFII